MDMQKILERGETVLENSYKTIVAPAIQKRIALKSEAKGEMYGETDFVTELDIKNEAFLLEHLTDIVPAFATGEESFDNDPDAKRRMSEGLSWVVDPLDGTNNVKKYVEGQTNDLPSFGIMAALLKDGLPIAGWVLASHKGSLTIASGGLGQRAIITDLSGLPLSGEEVILPLLDAQFAANAKVVTTPSAWPNKIEPKFGDIIRQRADDGLWTHYGEIPKSAAVEWTLMLQGKANAAAFRQFRAWDHLPGAAIVSAAGGCVRTLQGRRRPTIRDQRLDGILATPDITSWEPIRRAMLGGRAYTRTEDPKVA